MTMTWGWILWLARIIHRFLSRSGVGASRWLATSGSPEQLGWRNRSHAGKECATHAVRVSHRLTPTGTFSVSLHGYGNVRGACEARSRSKEKAMQGHRRRRATQRSPATPISPKGGGGTASISLSLLLHDITDIASSSIRELDAVALATNVTTSMKRGTKEAGGTRLRVAQACSTLDDWVAAVENLCIIRANSGHST